MTLTATHHHVAQPVESHPDLDVTIVADIRLTADGAKGPGVQLSRDERSQRTSELLARADCARRVGDDAEADALLDDVVVLNCRVADAVASRYRDRGVPLEDLRQAAYEGLVKAVRRFDPEHADDLLTFAVPTIRGEVQRHFRDRSWMVRPPRRLQDLQGRVNTAVRELQNGLGREPSTAEICAAVGIGAEEYTEVMLATGCFHPPSLDRQVGDADSDTTLGDLIADDTDELEAVETRSVLAPVLRDLGERDRELIRLRFFEERTQREIGEHLGLTQAQVSRLLDRLLRRLRDQVDPGHLERRAFGAPPVDATQPDWDAWSA